MNTLVTFHQQPLSITNPPLWRYQKSKPLHPTTIKTLLSFSSSSWALHAQAKGFGGSSMNSDARQENKKTPKKSEGEENKDDDDDDKIPQVVFDRMIRRILAYVGLPMATGVVLLQVFGFLKEKHLLNVPLWVPFLTTFLTFGTSVLGVAYGSISTSWDAEKEGSLLGFEQVQQNWNDMWKEEENQSS